MADEQFYEKAAREIERGRVRRGLWLKCLAESNGDEAQAKAAYLRVRARELQAETQEFEVWKHEERRRRRKEKGELKATEFVFWFVVIIFLGLLVVASIFYLSLIFS